MARGRKPLMSLDEQLVKITEEIDTLNENLNIYNVKLTKSLKY